MSSPLEEKDAIRELLARYCFHFDNGEFEAWLDLFTADGVFDLGSRGRFAGHDALRTFLTMIPLTGGLPMMRHCVMNAIVEVDEDRARARCYVVVLRGGSAVSINVAGRYEDRLVKLDGSWRFKERTVRFDLMSQP